MAPPRKYTDDELESRVLDYLKNWETLGDKIPTVSGLACELDVSRETVYEWCRKKPWISDILQKLMANQERKLTNGGLGGEFNPVLTKLFLSKHGYHEKQEVEHVDKEKVDEIKETVVDPKPKDDR